MTNNWSVRRLAALILFVGILGNGRLRADDWTSSDNIISVKQPDGSRFVQLEPTPPLSVIWTSQDESIKLGIAIIQLPRSMELIQTSIEKGLAEEINGKIVASDKSQRGGHQVFTMTATGEVAGNPVYITQSVVAIGEKVYKAMAIGIGKDTRTNSDSINFIGSLKVLPAAEQTPPVEAARKMPQPADGSLIDQLSERIGGISLLVLLGCAALALASRISSKRASKPK
jgi:hypothetical protein